MTSPLAKGKFARAIVQSGLGGRVLPAIAKARGRWSSAYRAGQDFAQQAGAGDGRALRALPAQALLADPPSLYRGFGPVIDGLAVREDPLAAFAAGRAARVPLMIGYNSHEVPVAAIGGAEQIDAFLGFTPGQRAQWRARYSSDTTFEESVVSDLLFADPAVRLGSEHARNGNSVWLYEFAVLPSQSPLTGAPHASERAYVFGNLTNAAWPTRAADTLRSRALRTRWTTFATTSSPELPGAARWRPLRASPPELLRMMLHSEEPAPAYRHEGAVSSLLPH